MDPNTALNIFDGCSRPVSQRGYAHRGGIRRIEMRLPQMQPLNGPLSSFASAGKGRWQNLKASLNAVSNGRLKPAATGPKHKL